MNWSFANYSNFSYSQEMMDAYLRAFENWITTQKSIEKANVDWNITRQAMAKMVVNFSKNILKTTQDKKTSSVACKFKDKNSITSDLKTSVEEACKIWLMWQGVEYFDPQKTLSRAQFWTILSRALWWDTYDWGEPYYEKHLKALQDAWIMNNIDNPNIKEKRWNVMIMMMRWENLIKDYSKRNKQQKSKTTKNNENEELTPWSWVVWDKEKWTLTISYKKRSITIMDKNLWAKEAWIWESSIWHLFVWWNNKGFYFDDTKNGTWFLSVKEGNWKEWAKWPCPKWYHIPTKSERQTVIDLWKSNNPKIKGKLIGKQFSKDLFLPAIGTRQEAAWRAEWKTELWEPHLAYYWVSTPNRLLTGTITTGNTHLYLSFDTKPVFWWTWEPVIWGVLANWNLETAIRCFAGEWTSQKKSSSSSSTTKSTTKSSASSTATTSTKEEPSEPKFSFYFF